MTENSQFSHMSGVSVVINPYLIATSDAQTVRSLLWARAVDPRTKLGTHFRGNDHFFPKRNSNPYFWVQAVQLRLCSGV